MRQRHGLLWAMTAVLLALTGCHGGLHHRKGGSPSFEPGLADVSSSDGVVLSDNASETDPVLVDTTPQQRRFADRPIARKTQEAYDSGQGNRFAKGARAAIIGVPQGIGAEVKQLFTGPTTPTGY